MFISSIFGSFAMHLNEHLIDFIDELKHTLHLPLNNRSTIIKMNFFKIYNIC
jgi:GT2 family glycosyltransferase